MRRAVLLAALLLAVPVGLLPAAASAAAPAQPLGADVSAPQCTGDGLTGFSAPATAVAFAVVGVTDGVGTVANPCLAAEAAWASALPGGGRAPLELYINTQHPAPKAARWWPHSDRTAAGRLVTGRYGHCTGADTAACGFVYGASIADDDLARASAALLVPAAHRWWLDVETTNTWGRDRTVNRAVLEGTAAALTRAGAPIGLYSTHRQWDAIVGPVPGWSPLSGAATWLAGAVTVSGAMLRCESTPLVARSRVELAQAVGATADTDVACGRIGGVHSPHVTGSARVGALLHAVTPAWSPSGVRFLYRWLRDGRPIRSATAAAYRVTGADRHRNLSVRVTGLLAGDDAAVRVSASRRIH